MKLWLATYAGLGRALGPLLRLHVRRRRDRGKEDPERAGERFGRDARPRPGGPLVWIHAASIGESLSILPVIDRLRRAADGPSVLLSTVTRSSAELVAARLPDGALHAYAPFDTAPALDRFLRHWRPDATVIVEQELWPLMLERGPAPRLLVNARLSARSARRWQRARPIARALLDRFAVVLAQSRADAERLRALGARTVETPGNLKLATPPLAVDETALEAFQTATEGRPIWVAASTHEPEETWIAEVDRTLRQRIPDLLTVLVPRHPERAAAIRAQLRRPDLALRSACPLPGPEVGMLLVDGFGALGLFYRAASLAFVGGSLIPHGGQNPLEPARLGRPVLYGPHMSNFEEPAAMLEEAGAARRVDRANLADAAATWLADDAARTAAGEAAAAAVATAGDAAIARTTAVIREALGLR